MLLVFLGWRFLTFLTTVVAGQFAGEGPPADVGVILRRSADRWDAGWYLAIARDGYSLAETGQANVAFYPVLPALIRLLSFVAPWRVAGSLIVNVALLGAVLYLYALVQLDYDEPTALRAVVFLLLFPSAIFLTAIYTEPLLLLTMIASLYHARRGHWWLAGAWGLAAGLTKLVGAMIVVALLWEWWRQVRMAGFQWRRHLPHLIAVALPPLGALGFLVYLHLRFGSYRVYFAVQEAWYRQSVFRPFFPDGRNFLGAFLRGDGLSVVNYFYPQGGTTIPSPSAFMVLDLTFLVVGLAVGLLACLHIRGSYGLLILAVLGLAAYSGSPQSLNRIALILFPLPIAFALAGRSRPVALILFTLSGLLSVYHTFLFVNAFWAG